MSFNTGSGKPVANIVPPWQSPACFLVLVITDIQVCLKLDKNFNLETFSVTLPTLDDIDEMSLIQENLCDSLFP